MRSRRPGPFRRFLLWLALIGVVALWVTAPALFPGNSKLYDAIAAGDEAAARRLLADGADPNSRSLGLAGGDGGLSSQYSPLLYAINRNEPAIAVLLLEAGAEPNVRNPENDTALIAAADAGMVDVVRLLLEKGADPGAANDWDGSTPLHLGRAFDVAGAPSPKTFLDPAIQSLLEAAGAR